MTWISWIVPLYKGKKYISGILTNMQEIYTNLQDAYQGSEYCMEVLLVNDDPSESIEVPKYPFKISVIQHKTNRGIHQARITGLQAAKGEFIVFLDQDDHVEPSFLTRHLQVIGSADVCVANGYREYLQGKELLYTKKAAMKLTGQYKMYLFGTDMIFSPGQCLIRKASVPELWQQSVMQTNGCDDFLLWILLFKENAKFVYLWEPLYYHLETEHNFSNDYSRMDRSFAEMIEILEKGNILIAKELNVLKKRLSIKQDKRNSMEKALLKIMLSPRMLYCTLKYKLCGYK